VQPLEAPFRWQDDHIAAEVNGARALFTTRRGGVSEGPFASLNLGLKTDDERANVEENRARAAAATGHAWDDFLYGWQVHGATVRRATGPRPRPTAQEDGQATTLTGHPALVFVADCTPVLLVAADGVAALHCGWRGTAAGILAEGVAALDGEITALIGQIGRAHV